MIIPVKNFLILFCINLVLSGCISSSAPKDNVDFARVESLSDLDGTYQNQGEGKLGPVADYLSSLIWPEEKINPKSIEFIEVKALNDNTVRVKGIWGKEIVKESLLVEGKDFNLDSGRIAFGKNVGFYGETGPLAGPHASGFELGIDQHGHGKLKESGFFAGLVFLAIPVAYGGSYELRFRRIK